MEKSKGGSNHQIPCAATFSGKMKKPGLFRPGSSWCARRESNRTDLITKVLYPEIAAEFSDKDTRVERAIRTAICACWDSYGRDELNKMAGYTLEKRPTNLEFIDLVAAYIRYILDR